jgi:hypothetical protein
VAIENDRDLRRAAEQAGALLQEIQNYLEERNVAQNEFNDAKVRFPRGFIRPASLQRLRLPFVEDRALRDNLAYTLILSDTILWLKLRTDLWGVPREMLVKLSVFLVGTLVESITKEYLTGLCGQNFTRRNEYLVRHGVITEPLRQDLDWVWDTRNRMHLFQLEGREYENPYDQQCHSRCIRTFRSLLTALSARGRLQTG